MAKKKRRRTRPRKTGADVFGMVRSARDASKTALRHLRGEIDATRKRLEKLVGEERSFRLDLFGTGALARSRKVGRPRKTGRPTTRKATVRKAKPHRKGPPRADRYFAKLPSKFSVEDVRKLAGKATGVSLAQWARAKKVKKTAAGYEKVA
jgi:hypothetical protein